MSGGAEVLNRPVRPGGAGRRMVPGAASQARSGHHSRAEVLLAGTAGRMMP
jgi:hypothetical protein